RRVTATHLVTCQEGEALVHVLDRDRRGGGGRTDDLLDASSGDRLRRGLGLDRGACAPGECEEERDGTESDGLHRTPGVSGGRRPDPCFARCPTGFDDVPDGAR